MNAPPRPGVCWSAVICGIVAAVLAAHAPALQAQSQEFQFVVSAFDAEGLPVTDLSRDEVVLAENGVPATVVRIQPFPIPVRLTIAVDNGPDSIDALGHYRTGLTGLVDALPGDLEVTLITTAPQPRMVVRPTTDRVRIRRGITGFAPEDARPRFTDALVEYAKRLELDWRDREVLDFLPVLVMVSTTANESSSYQVPEIEKALRMLVARRARVMVTMTSTQLSDATNIDTNRQSLIAIPTTKLTGGRYESIAVSSRLTTLLPEFGREIAALHVKHANQLLVTVQRAEGATGPLQNPTVHLTRPAITGSVSVSGLP
jgi:hypothetical protein